MQKKNIALIGFMGTGKSLISKKLAVMLKREVVSTDDLIEKKEGRSINQIFEESGEVYFRELEVKAVREAASKESVIIDCGGGVVLNPLNILELQKNSISFFLGSSVEKIYERLKNKENRPLLKGPDALSRIRQLLEQRKSFYAQADYTIDTDPLTVEQVCEEIIRLLGINA